MLDTLVDDLKHMPSRLKATPERLRGAPKQLRARRNKAVADARHRAHLARGEGAQRLWTLQTTALDRADELLTRGKELPVVNRAVPTAERLVHQRLDAVTRVPVADYDSMNVKQAAAAIRELGWVDLLNVRRHELANKDRKTVYRAVDAALDQLRSEPVAEPLSGAA